MAKMTRYLVRRKPDGSGEVFIWTAALAARGDFEEVYADSPKEALTKDSMPDPKNMTLGQLEKMKKVDLMLFGKVKFGLELSGDMSMAEMRDLIKEKWFSTPLEDPEGKARGETRPMATALQARNSPGA